MVDEVELADGGAEVDGQAEDVLVGVGVEQGDEGAGAGGEEMPVLGVFYRLALLYVEAEVGETQAVGR